MEQLTKVPQATNDTMPAKDTLRKKAGDVFENVKEKAEVKAEELINKVKESELAGKAKEKFRNVKEETKGLFNKVSDKFSAKK